ncbi:MAG: FtsX-like permease family protein [Bdellovibrionales bacterium]|nr:FtsX-like permease family protein [Bdellovibrionales bacterium]
MKSNNSKQTQSLHDGLMFSFYLFRKYFFSSRGVSLIRTVFWVCLGGITVSVAALILIVSIMGGFGQSIMKRHLAGEPHLVSELKQNPFQNQILLKKTLPNSLRQEIKSTVFYETQDVIIKTKEGFSGAMARGYSLKKWTEKKLTTMEWSPPLSNKRTPLPELLITQKLALDLSIFKGDEILLIPAVALLLPPGESLPLQPMKVAGILDNSETKAQSMEQSLMVFYKQGKVDFGAFSKPKYGAEIKLQDPHQSFLYKPYFKKVQTWQERNSSLFFALKLEKFIMTLFITLALVISCLGISSALFLLMTQKGKDIGMFQALGLSQKELCQTFTRLGFCLALCGICLGTLVGVGGVAFFKYTDLNFLPEMYQDRNIPAIFEPTGYALIIVGSMLVAWLSCYLPARTLSHTDPAHLLKISGR